MSILNPVPHCLDYFNFIISSEIGKYESSNLFFPGLFGYSGPLAIPYEFEDQLFHFFKK